MQSAPAACPAAVARGSGDGARGKEVEQRGDLAPALVDEERRDAMADHPLPRDTDDCNGADSAARPAFAVPAGEAA